jgi:proteasome lid subunit RPN8/RPN11
MLCLTKEQANEIINQAKREAPNEACGILAGPPTPMDALYQDGLRGVNKEKRVTKVYPMINTDKSPQTFFMDPKEQLRVMKEIRNLGLEMVGIYHSHLQTRAYPSARDTELAFYPEASFVIVSISDKDNPNIRSFRIVEGKIEEEELIIQ